MRFVRCKTTSGYEAMILTPEQAYAVFRNLRDPERTLTLLAAGTGLRISECLGLQWQDVSFADAMIHVRRTWTCGQVGLPKSKASKGPVPLHPLLAEFMLRWKQKTPYSRLGDWVFPSDRLKGEQPRVANMLREREKHIELLDGWLAKAKTDLDGLMDVFRKQTEALEESNRWAEGLTDQLEERGARVIALQEELAAEQAKARERVDELEAEFRGAGETGRRLAEELERKVRELAQCVDALHATERTLEERTAWAQKAQGELDALVRQIHASAWIKIGRKLRLSQVLNSPPPSGNKP